MDKTCLSEATSFQHLHSHLHAIAKCACLKRPAKQSSLTWKESDTHESQETHRSFAHCTQLIFRYFQYIFSETRGQDWYYDGKLVHSWPNQSKSFGEFGMHSASKRATSPWAGSIESCASKLNGPCELWRLSHALGSYQYWLIRTFTLHIPSHPYTLTPLHHTVATFTDSVCPVKMY